MELGGEVDQGIGAVRVGERDRVGIECDRFGRLGRRLDHVVDRLLESLCVGEEEGAVEPEREDFRVDLEAIVQAGIDVRAVLRVARQAANRRLRSPCDQHEERKHDADEDAVDDVDEEDSGHRAREEHEVGAAHAPIAPHFARS